jgi:feruloyl-CoA synthase
MYYGRHGYTEHWNFVARLMINTNTLTGVSPRETRATRLPDGGWRVNSTQVLGYYPRCVGDVLEHWGVSDPDRVFLAERDGDDQWRSVSYGEALKRVRSIAQAFIERGLSPDRPLLTLSKNSVDHGLVILAAMHAGIPVVPVAPAYASASKDYAKLRHVFDLIKPQLVYVDRAASYEGALKAIGCTATLLASDSEGADASVELYADFVACIPDARLDASFRAVGPDTIGKVLMTSGSTGMPKGVINTQRMMCSNMQAVSQVYHYWSEQPPVQLSWMPWNHTAGGNHAFHTTLWHGGALYIDDGRPVAGQFERTVHNLRDRRVAVTSYMSVPLAYAMLLTHLESEPELRNTFFSQLRYLGAAGAGIPKDHWQRLQSMASEVSGRSLLFGTNWGATETGPTATAVFFQSDRPNNIGLPIPGVDLRLVPTDGKLELRLKAPFVTQGYWGQPELSREAFDEYGYYRTGDAGKLIDESHPEEGIQFDGRIAEDFKLATGTWVSVGTVRTRVIQAGMPLIQDVVITGHNQQELGMLVFLNDAECRRRHPEAASLDSEAIGQLEAVRVFVQEVLSRLAAESPGSSTRPARALIMLTPPKADHSEITEKGNLNQRAVLQNRSVEVEKLHSSPLHPEVVRAS